MACLTGKIKQNVLIADQRGQLRVLADIRFVNGNPPGETAQVAAVTAVLETMLNRRL